MRQDGAPRAAVTQTRSTGQSNQPRGNARRKGRGEAASRRTDAATRQLRRAVQLRREQAVAALTETADAARRIEDLDSRARIQALVADALWAADEAAARAYFRRAWETATAFDHAEQEAAKTDAPALALEVFTEARQEVLTRAAARDSRLADIFLQELVKEKTEDGERRASEAQAGAAEPQASRRTAWRELSANGQQRLSLALALLNQRDYRQAARIAAPLAEEGASAQLLSFLLRLRPVAAPEADALYLRLLQKTLSDMRADANDVLLLSSYVVSPELIVVVDERGALLFRATNLQPAMHSAMPDVRQMSVRPAFFETAASVLLRPLPTPDGEGNQHHVASYFAIGRLLPFFEREAREPVPELQARQASLANELDANRRERLASQSGVQSVTPKNPTDPLRPQLDNLARVRDPKRRDLLRLRIVRTAAQRRLWERARSLAAQIETDETQRAARLIIALHQIKNLRRDFKDDTPHDAGASVEAVRTPDDFDRAATFVRQLDAPPAARAYGLAQAATLAAERGNRARAAELLEEAARLAETTVAGTNERIAALGSVALAAARLDTRRAFELLPSVVGAINAVEDYTGDFDDGDASSVPDDTARDLDDAGAAVADEAEAELDDFLKAFRLDELFATMGRLDFARTLDEARALKRETPRAFAVVAVARAALDAPAAKHAGQEAR